MSDSRVFGFEFSYHVKGGPKDPLAVKQLSTAFERAAVEFGKFGEYAFPRLIPVLEKEVKGQFDAEGHGPNRGKWAPLSPKYAEWKRRRALGALYAQKTKRGRTKASALKAAAAIDVVGLPKLVLTGALRAALTNSSSPFANRAYSATSMNYGTHGVKYASFHQAGTAHMPDRPPFDFDAGFSVSVQAAALAGARDLIKASQVDKFTSGNPAATNAGLDAALDSALARDE